MKPLLFDSRGYYFQDKRRCYWCDSMIRIDEKYDFIVLSCSGLRVYFCEKCFNE